MSKRTKASDYTHSVWSGAQYERPQTAEELAAEGRAVLDRHPTIVRSRQVSLDDIRRFMTQRRA